MRSRTFEVWLRVIHANRQMSCCPKQCFPASIGGGELAGENLRLASIASGLARRNITL
jgi:hypothetical protein